MLCKSNNNDIEIVILFYVHHIHSLQISGFFSFILGKNWKENFRHCHCHCHCQNQVQIRFLVVFIFIFSFMLGKGKTVGEDKKRSGLGKECQGRFTIQKYIFLSTFGVLILCDFIKTFCGIDNKTNS